MALRHFQGSYDLDKMSPTDLSRMANTLASLEALATLGVITFQIKVARPHKVRPAPSGRLQPQRQKIADAVTGERWWTAREVSDALGLNRNSINAQLGELAKLGVIEAQTRALPADPERAFGRKTVRVFRKLPA